MKPTLIRRLRDSMIYECQEAADALEAYEAQISAMQARVAAITETVCCMCGKQGHDAGECKWTKETK